MSTLRHTNPDAEVNEFGLKFRDDIDAALQVNDYVGDVLDIHETKSVARRDF